jgi:AcrR family transcriptional regulator
MPEGRRGAVRSTAAHTAVLRAAAELVERVGFERMTIEGIAQAAGVGKQTIYRWWSSKSAIVAEALFEGVLFPESFMTPDTGDIAADLTSWLESVFRYLRDPAHAGLLVSLIGGAVADAEIGLRLTERLGAAPSSLLLRLEQAAADGRLAGDPRIVADALIGVIVMRVLTRAPVPAADAAALVALVLGGGTGRPTY